MEWTERIGKVVNQGELRVKRLNGSGSVLKRNEVWLQLGLTCCESKVTGLGAIEDTLKDRARRIQGGAASA